MISRAALWLLAVSAVSTAARAETVYVIEQVVVSVAGTPSGESSESERVGQVKSGDKLELIERQGDEAHIRLADGKEGWIKASYLSNEEPLSRRLSARTEEIDKLRQDGDRQKQEAEKLRQEVGRLQTELSASHPATPAAAPEPTRSAPEPIRDTAFLRQPDRGGQTPWALLIGISAAMLLVGFALGWTTLDRRIRQKYGGLKIY
jgi:hypothetical protein